MGSISSWRGLRYEPTQVCWSVVEKREKKKKKSWVSSYIWKSSFCVLFYLFQINENLATSGFIVLPVIGNASVNYQKYGLIIINDYKQKRKQIQNSSNRINWELIFDEDEIKVSLWNKPGFFNVLWYQLRSAFLNATHVLIIVILEFVPNWCKIGAPSGCTDIIPNAFLIFLEQFHDFIKVRTNAIRAFRHDLIFHLQK